MQQVIPASGVLQYEQYGFTNCVRFEDVLYLSGISALDPQGRVIGHDIETQAFTPTGTSSGCCAPPAPTSAASSR